MYVADTRRKACDPSLDASGRLHQSKPAHPRRDLHHPRLGRWGLGNIPALFCFRFRFPAFPLENIQLPPCWKETGGGCSRLDPDAQRSHVGR